MKKRAKKSELFQYEISNRRQFFRVKPSRNEPVMIGIHNHEKEAIDISAGGLCFQNFGNFKPGDIFSAKINLPGCSKIILAEITVIEVCVDLRCHCRFLNMDEDQRELIHRYCLSRQKELINLSKKKKPGSIRPTACSNK